MEILDLRHFSSADLRPLLEDEIAMWGRLLFWDYATSAEMILRYMDAKILPGYAAIERGSIFGYSFFVYEQSKGVIGDLFVRDGARGSDRHEVEERLLTHVIETLQQSPGIHRVEAQLLAHHTGEVSRPFLQQGFSRHPRVFMNFEIGKHPQTAPPLPAQFEIRPWSEQEYQSAAALITAAYRGHVDSEINDQYRTLTGSLRFLNNIVRFPGLRNFRSAGVIPRLRAPHSDADRTDFVLAGAARCGPHHAGVRASRISLGRPRRSHAGGLDSESSRARISVSSR